MRKTGTCPKCGSRNLRSYSGITDPELLGFSIPTVKSLPQGQSVEDWEKTRDHERMEVLVCQDCGFVELYVNIKNQS
jgi:predicted nucleic-acid-binding Zn-ribbon protein